AEDRGSREAGRLGRDRAADLRTIHVLTRTRSPFSPERGVRSVRTRTPFGQNEESVLARTRSPFSPERESVRPERKVRCALAVPRLPRRERRFQQRLQTWTFEV